MLPGPALPRAERSTRSNAVSTSAVTLPPRVGSSFASSSCISRPESRFPGRSSRRAQATPFLGAGALFPTTGDLTVAWYATCGWPSGRVLILNSRTRRSRTSSKCNVPMNDKSLSPVSSLVSRRRPSPACKSTSNARSSASRCSGFRPPSCSAKVQRPRLTPLPGSAALWLASAMGTSTGSKTMSPSCTSCTCCTSPRALCTSRRFGVTVTTLLESPLKTLSATTPAS
mmetsp:Transcript_37992/g.68717  ORF Transcript_37992/g.68717 Transcript_37992/m.68717 type:complete len:228 (-) Transcript_37992:450-1133(-)